MATKRLRKAVNLSSFDGVVKVLNGFLTKVAKSMDVDNEKLTSDEVLVFIDFDKTLEKIGYDVTSKIEDGIIKLRIERPGVQNSYEFMLIEAEPGGYVFAYLPSFAPDHGIMIIRKGKKTQAVGVVLADIVMMSPKFQKYIEGRGLEYDISEAGFVTISYELSDAKVAIRLMMNKEQAITGKVSFEGVEKAQAYLFEAKNFKQLEKKINDAVSVLVKSVS